MNLTSQPPKFLADDSVVSLSTMEHDCDLTRDVGEQAYHAFRYIHPHPEPEPDEDPASIFDEPGTEFDRSAACERENPVKSKVALISIGVSTHRMQRKAW